MKRNLTVDLIKLVFAISIANSHFLGSFFDAGLVVIAFFVMSGFFLAKSQEKRPEQTAWNYTLCRLERIYPEYIVALCALFLTINLTDWNGLGG